MRRKEETKTTILLARHGESEGNERGLFRGRTDFPLTERGIAQAKSLAQVLTPLGPTRIFTSPLRRALDTAQALAEAASAPCETVQGLINMALGPWEGHSKDDVAQNYPEEWELWLKNPERLRLPGAESLDQVQSRAYSNLQHLLQRHQGETLVIVSHRSVLKPLVAACLAIADPYFWRLHFDTASLSTLTFESRRGFTLVALNDTNHLREFVSEWV